MEFMTVKQKQYAAEEDKLAKALRMSGFRKEVSHEAILDLKAKLDAAESAELKPLKAKLESYRGLPPNSQLALARLAEAERELEELTLALTKEISSLHV
jgi:hypothetical protein